MKNQISALVITYNEENNIEKCLNSLKWIDELIVIDTYSKDETITLVKNYSIKIFFKKFENDFSKLRSYGVHKCINGWILCLDADEVLPQMAKAKIRKLIKNKKIDGYWFPRKNYINKNTYLKHGIFYPDYQLRLFRKTKFKNYKGVVHEQPILNSSKTFKIRDLEIIHNCTNTKYDSFFSFYRLFHYINIEAKSLASTTNRLSNLVIKLITEPIKIFRLSFFIEKGYRDGYIGFRAAAIYSLYRFVVYLLAIILKFRFR